MVMVATAIYQLDLRYRVDQIGHRERDLLMNSNNGKCNKNNNRKMVAVLLRYLVNLLKKQLCSSSSNSNNNNSSNRKKTHSKQLCLTIQCSRVQSLILLLGHYLEWRNSSNNRPIHLWKWWIWINYLNYNISRVRISLGKMKPRSNYRRWPNKNQKNNDTSALILIDRMRFRCISNLLVGIATMTNKIRELPHCHNNISRQCSKHLRVYYLYLNSSKYNPQEFSD